MRTVFLVPRRDDGGHRDRLWAYARKRWEILFPDWEIVEGHHDDGPFNRSMAVNRAAKAAGDWDVGIVIDSDVMLKRSQVLKAVASAEAGKVTWGHRRWRGISEDWTRRILEDQAQYGPEFKDVDLDILVERTNPLSWSCCIAIPRQIFDDLGGFDERFRGWGFEDMAFQSVIVGLYPWDRVEGDVIHLWHPRSSERIVQGAPGSTASREYVTNALLGRRYMYALRRDHYGHDRPGGPATEEERERDLQNLRRDDEKFRRMAQSYRLPDWSDWWPTLEELRDGARIASRPPERAFSIILRTGGEPDTWEARKAYLTRSIASLSERVKGNIVQRVIYSDWGDHHEELTEIAGRHGFYVVGSGHHGYTQAVRRLWAYIDRRAIGDFVFLAEDDFVYDRDVDLNELADPLEADPYLAQVALMRGPVFPRETEGLLGWDRESFTQVDGHLEHRNFWTMNPSLIRRNLVTTHSWPNASSSERVFGDLLLRNPRARFGIAGQGEPWITHIGEVRSTSKY